jgi:hypothetical protein
MKKESDREQEIPNVLQIQQKERKESGSEDLKKIHKNRRYERGLKAKA